MRAFGGPCFAALLLLLLSAEPSAEAPPVEPQVQLPQRDSLPSATLPPPLLPLLLLPPPLLPLMRIPGLLLLDWTEL
jgi:hypothetical protein